MIEKKLVRLHWKEAIPEIALKLNGYRSKWKRVYIGVTTDPEKRWKKHNLNGYPRWFSSMKRILKISPSI